MGLRGQRSLLVQRSDQNRHDSQLPGLHRSQIESLEHLQLVLFYARLLHDVRDEILEMVQVRLSLLR